MRHASSMIELVIAIVIMGIAVMTLPLMLEQTQKNNEFTLQQEIILAARTKLGDTLTYRWDENSLNNDRIVVLRTNGDSELNPSIGNRRVGHVHANKRRKFAFDNNATSNVNLGPDAGDIDDIDDFKSVTTSLTGTQANLDYRYTDFNMTTNVTYVDDNATYSNTIVSYIFPTTSVNNSTNIKMVTLNITGSTSPFTLRTYSCNIGESEFLRRDY